MKLPLHFVTKVTAAGILIALLLPIREASPQITQGWLGTPPVVSIADAPPGTETLAVEWVKVAAPGSGVMLAAVSRPRGAGPFPTVILLHGSHGFAHGYVRLAQDLAGGGVLAMAACWFRGGAGSGVRFVTPVGCPEAPPMPNPPFAEANEAYRFLGKSRRNYNPRITSLSAFLHNQDLQQTLQPNAEPPLSQFDGRDYRDD